MREQFEKWCYENKWNTFRYPENWENGGEYCDSFVNGAWYAFQEQQKRIDAIKKMIVSLRSEFDLWSDDTESFDAIESQIENLEELLK